VFHVELVLVSLPRCLKIVIANSVAILHVQYSKLFGICSTFSRTTKVSTARYVFKKGIVFADITCHIVNKDMSYFVRLFL
jgi:hypothetical protein